MSSFDPKDMEFRFLGRTGLKVSALSLGGWVTYGKGKQVEDDIARKCMHQAYELGCNFFDTAEVYGSGESERTMGKVIKEAGWKRSDIVVSTKLFWAGSGPNDIGLSRKHLLEGIDKSLERLQMDYVDVLFAHRPDRRTPMEEIVRAFTHIIKMGKAFYWGTSEWSAFEIEHAHHIATKYNLIAPVVEQPQYNAFERNKLEAEYIPLFREYGYGTTVWSPLASGVLSGKYNDGVPDGSRFSEENMKKEPFLRSIYEKLQSEEGRSRIQKASELGLLAKELGCSIAALSLAWCLSNKNVSTVLTGASKPEQIKDNFEAIKVYKKLDSKILEKIEKILGNKPAEEELFRRWA